MVTLLRRSLNQLVGFSHRKWANRKCCGAWSGAKFGGKTASWKRRSKTLRPSDLLSHLGVNPVSATPYDSNGKAGAALEVMVQSLSEGSMMEEAMVKQIG